MSSTMRDESQEQKVTLEYVHISATGRANDAEFLARLSWSTTLVITGLGIFLGDVLGLAWLAGLFMLAAGLLVLFRWRIQRVVLSPLLGWWRS